MICVSLTFCGLLRVSGVAGQIPGERPDGAIGIEWDIRINERGKFEFTYRADAEFGGGVAAFDPSTA